MCCCGHSFWWTEDGPRGRNFLCALSNSFIVRVQTRNNCLSIRFWNPVTFGFQIIPYTYVLSNECLRICLRLFLLPLVNVCRCVFFFWLVFCPLHAIFFCLFSMDKVLRRRQEVKVEWNLLNPETPHLAIAFPEACMFWGRGRLNQEFSCSGTGCMFVFWACLCFHQFHLFPSDMFIAAKKCPCLIKLLWCAHTRPVNEVGNEKWSKRQKSGPNPFERSAIRLEFTPEWNLSESLSPFGGWRIQGSTVQDPLPFFFVFGAGRQTGLSSQISDVFEAWTAEGNVEQIEEVRLSQRRLLSKLLACC